MGDLDLTLAVKVSSPELRKLTEDLQRVGLVGGQGMSSLQRGALGAEDAMKRLTRSASMVEAIFKGYLLYRGFTFLKNQAVDFTRSLVDLEHQLGLVQAQLGRVGFDARPTVGRAIMGIGQQTGRGFAELAKTQTQIISANIELSKSFGILDRSARAATAGGLTDATLAFDAALSQVNAFNLGVDSFNEVFDKQFNLVRRGVFTYQQFATVVGTISESFASMGQDIDTANASLAAISQIFTGPQLERGATGLRNAVLRLGEAREDFEALGVAVTDTGGDFRNFIDVGRDLNMVLAGMTESERFATIKGLFPDERERRGMEAFLDTLDQAEEFLVEQRFAIGDLDAAFKTVNESTLQQARILRSELIPALEPVVGLFGGFLTVVNSANKELPGFTQNIIQLALAYGALRAAQSFGGGVSTPFLGPARGPMGMRGLPTGMGLALGAGTLGLAGSGGVTQGFSLAGLLGNAGSGAIVGAGLGGGPGAAIGGLAGGLAFAIGSAFEKKAPDIGDAVGKSMADVFVEELKKGGLEDAILAAVGARNAPGTGLGAIVAAVQSRQSVFPPSGSNWRDILSGRSGPDMRGEPIYERARSFGDIAEGLMGRMSEFDERMASMADVFTDREVAELRQAYIDSIVDTTFSLEGLSGEAKTLQMSRRAVLGGTLSDPALQDPRALHRYLLLLGGDPRSGLAPDPIRAERFRRQFGQGRSRSTPEQFVGDAEQVASVFETIGSEGEKLATQFREFARVMSAMEMFRAFSDMKVGGKGFFEWLGVDRAAVESTIAGEMAGMLAGPDGVVTADEVAQAFLHPLEEAGDAVDEFANRIRRNTLQIEEIQKRAAMQGRGLTAEEFALIRQLDYANTAEEIGRFNRQTGATYFGSDAAPSEPMETVTLYGHNMAGGSGAVRRVSSPGPAGMGFFPGVPLGEGGALTQGGFAMTPQQTLAKLEMARIHNFGRLATSQVDLTTLRRADAVSGGFRNDYGSWGMSALLQQLVEISRESARRGGQNIYFGETVPSELDMQIKRLRDLGPVLVRKAGGVR